MCCNRSGDWLIVLPIFCRDNTPVASAVNSNRQFSAVNSRPAGKSRYSVLTCLIFIQGILSDGGLLFIRVDIDVAHLAFGKLCFGAVWMTCSRGAGLGVSEVEHRSMVDSLTCHDKVPDS